MPSASIIAIADTGIPPEADLRLFQNRFKSILCQEDLYLKELVGYIHLNPLRAKIVAELKDLAKYPYGGHSVLMGKQKRVFQDVDYVLQLFGDKVAKARRNYREYVRKRIDLGRRAELVGGGLLRSSGSWGVLKAMSKARIHLKGDERVLGDSKCRKSHYIKSNRWMIFRYC